MSLRRLVLYFLVLLLAAGGYFASESYHRRQEAQQEAAKKVFQVKAEEIRSLSLKTDRGEIRLERDPANPESWELVQPLKSAVDRVTLKAVLDTLANLKSQRRLADIPADRWPEFGLDKPLLTIDFQAGDRRHRLRFGNKVPGNGQYYALADAEIPILLVSAADKESLDRNLTAFRDKTLFTLAPEQVTAVTVQRGPAPLVFRKQEAAWLAPGPPPLQLRPDKVEGWLRQLQLGRIVEFIAEKPADPAKYGLAPPALRLTLAAGEKQETLLVGSLQGDRYYAQKQGQPTVFQIDRQLVDNLPQTAAAWEEKRLWAGPDSRVATLSWGADAGKATAVRSKNGWQLTLPAGQEGAPGAAMRVNLVLWKLKELEYTRLEPAPGAASGVYTLQLLDQQGEPLVTLDELRSEGGQTLLRWQARDKVRGAWVPQTAWGGLKQELANLAAPAMAKTEAK